jgi:hypothetical protein
MQKEPGDGLRRAWKETDHDRALEQLTALALELDHAHPGAASSLREGLEDTRPSRAWASPASSSSHRSRPIRASR